MVAAAATRRELLGASTLSAALTLAGCGGHAARASRARPPEDPVAERDAELLNGLLNLEYEVIAAYTATIPLLSGRTRTAAQRFLSQELSHAGEISGLVRQAKGKANPPRATYDLGAPRGAKAVLELLRGLEQRELDTKVAAVAQLSLGATRAAVTAVLGNDAQHLAVLSASLGLDPLPTALPGG